jgi:hypothetical protein
VSGSRATVATGILVSVGWWWLMAVAIVGVIGGRWELGADAQVQKSPAKDLLGLLETCWTTLGPVGNLVGVMKRRQGVFAEGTSRGCVFVGSYVAKLQVQLHFGYFSLPLTETVQLGDARRWATALP